MGIFLGRVLDYLLYLALFTGFVLFVGHTRYNLGAPEGRRRFGTAVLDFSPRTLLRAFYQPKPKPVQEPAVVVTTPPPPPEPPKPPPDYGNIRPVNGEEEDPDVLDPDIHLFPAHQKIPDTRFEEFNWRYFATREHTLGSWPKTTLDDFPTRISSPGPLALEQQVRRRLRPAYPVILDGYGWWQGASQQLELDDTYTDVIVRSYLALPEEQRPVVITDTRRGQNLTFLRYGFEPFTISRNAMDPHLGASMEYLLAAFTGPRIGWLWFSVARMRKAVMAAEREARAAAEALAAQKMAELAEITAQEREKAEVRKANRFTALWEVPEEVEWEVTVTADEVREPEPDTPADETSEVIGTPDIADTGGDAPADAAAEGGELATPEEPATGQGPDTPSAVLDAGTEADRAPPRAQPAAASEATAADPAGSRSRRRRKPAAADEADPS